MFPRFAFHQRDFLLLVKATGSEKNSRGGGFFFEMEKLLIMGKGEWIFSPIFLPPPFTF